MKIDPEGHNLVWPDGPDFDPATWHDWDESLSCMKQMAKNWERQPIESLLDE